MKTFLDSTTGDIYSFEDAAVSQDASGAYVFEDVNGASLNVPAGLTPYAPPTQSSVALLSAAQTAQIAVLRSACAERILSGYVSSALGDPRTYPSGTTDQVNMLGSVTASQLAVPGSGWTTPFWCRDAAGVWTFADHTATQIQQAGEDGKAMVVAAQTQLRDLTAQVMAATTTDAVALIVWGG